MSEWTNHRDEPPVGTQSKPASLTRHHLTNGSNHATFNEQSTGAVAIEYRINGSVSRKTLSKEESRVEWQRLISEGYKTFQPKERK